MLFIIIVIAGVLYFSSCGSGTGQKAGLNYKLLLAAVVCTSLIFVTAGKRGEMTAMFVISSLGLWTAFVYDTRLKKKLARDGQGAGYILEECSGSSLHPYGTEKIFRDAQESFGRTDSIRWLKKEDVRVPDSQEDKTVNVQVIKKYYVFGKNIYIQDSGAENSVTRRE